MKDGFDLVIARMRGRDVACSSGLGGRTQERIPFAACEGFAAQAAIRSAGPCASRGMAGEAELFGARFDELLVAVRLLAAPLVVEMGDSEAVELPAAERSGGERSQQRYGVGSSRDS